MTLWQVRAGRRGAQSAAAYDLGVVTVGWNEVPNLARFRNKEDLERVYIERYPNQKPRSIGKGVGQLWTFANLIRKGDLVALPLPRESAIAIGEVAGEYQYRNNVAELKHIRAVKWIKTIPRSSFDSDILLSLGAIQTVCKIARNDAENRVRTMLTDGKLKVPTAESAKPSDTEIIEGASADIDIEQTAKDQIVKFIRSNFVSHDLTRLVKAILDSQGYVTWMSPPGKDGGVDILAGTGALGFDEPKLCVQVKSSESPVESHVVQQLAGAMSRWKASRGLFVSWGGFTKDALKEEKDSFFSIRLWNQEQLIEEIMKNYDKFDDELKADLPLQRIWTLVKDEEE